MRELADPIASCSNYICSNCWLLDELRLRIDEQDSEFETLWYIREGEKYLVALFQEVVAPGRLSTSNSVSDQVQQVVIASEADKGILNLGTEESPLLTLSNRMLNWELNIQGYQTIRKDGQKSKGGGVALVVKDDIKVAVMPYIVSSLKNWVYYLLSGVCQCCSTVSMLG
eukprot:g33706.t1